MAISGVGMLTPAGLTTEETWRGVCAGAGLAAADRRLAGMPVDFACALPAEFSPEQLGPAGRRMDAFAQYATIAARQAVADAGLDLTAVGPQRVGVILGNGFGGLDTWTVQIQRLYDPSKVSPLTIPMSIASMAGAQVALDLGVLGPAVVVSTACAAGTTALGWAMQLLRDDRVDVMLAGGTEAGINRIVSAGFHRLQALSSRNGDPARASRPFDRDRDGFVLGEGAAVLVLCRAADASHAYASILGYGESTDAYHMTNPHPHAAGARVAIAAALADAGLDAAAVSHVNAHATSTPVGDQVEASLIRDLFPAASVTATKGVTGHLLGASGAVEAAITALAIHHGQIPPVANTQNPQGGLDLVTDAPRPADTDVAISQSFGFGGHNAVLVLGKP